MVSNLSWAALLPTINGTWKINVADLGAGDAGTVTAVSLFITYTAPTFAAGRWTGPAGTIYTDAAATTPVSYTHLDVYKRQTPGSTISSVASVCPNVNFTLSLQNASGLGTNYQWQSSPDGTTWTNVTGATNATLITTQSTAKYYRASVSCGANTAFSTAVQLSLIHI